MRLDAVNIRYVVGGPEEQRLVLRYSKVAQRWLIFEQRRNVSGGTGRIPQSCATRSLLRQESDASSGIRRRLPLCLSPHFTLSLAKFVLFFFSPSFSPFFI